MILFLVIVAALMTLGSLVWGLIAFIHADSTRSNQMMRWRVMLQGIAIVLFALAMMLR